MSKPGECAYKDRTCPQCIFRTVCETWQEMDSQFCPHGWAVITSDHNKAQSIISDIIESCGKTVSQSICNDTGHVIQFTDGTTLEWIRPNADYHYKRFGVLWCDEDITIRDFRNIMHLCYLGQFDDIQWI